MKRDQNQETWISFILDAETNKLLTDSAERSNRQKRREALIRLKDHLRQFRSISEVGHGLPHEK